MDLFGWNGSIICAIKSYLSEYLFYRIRKQQLGEFHTDSEQYGWCVIKINQCKPWLVWKTSSYFNQHSWKLLTENCQTVLLIFKINRCCAYRFFWYRLFWKTFSKIFSEHCGTMFTTMAIIKTLTHTHTHKR